MKHLEAPMLSNFLCLTILALCPTNWLSVGTHVLSVNKSYNPLCLRVKNLDNRVNYVNDQLEHILKTSTQA